MDRLLVRFVAANVVPLSEPKLKASETRPTPDAVASPHPRDLGQGISDELPFEYNDEDGDFATPKHDRNVTDAVIARAVA
jgi:hypothetical protein